MNSELPIIVFCHLRWNFVFQRPQHLLSRLAQHRRVIVIEEPERANEQRWETQTPCPGLLVCKPLTTIDAHGFHDAQLSAMAPMVKELLARENVDECVAWFYTPMRFR